MATITKNGTYSGTYEDENSASGPFDDDNLAYVVFGKADGSAIELSDMDEDTNNNGFIIANNINAL